MPATRDDLAEQYHQAVGDLPSRRAGALPALEDCFLRSDVPSALDGLLRGRLLATTVGPIVDAYARVSTSVWMPWQGKVLNHAASTGRNLFTNGWSNSMKVLWPGYDDTRPFDADHFTTFAFQTWEGPSVTDPRVRVFKIDYDHPESPRFIIRSVLDELIEIEPGLYLGQALLRWRGEWRRAAWFELSAA
jgi:hypothetical protein